MKRFIIYMVCAIMVILSFAACGNVSQLPDSSGTSGGDISGQTAHVIFILATTEIQQIPAMQNIFVMPPLLLRIINRAYL